MGITISLLLAPLTLSVGSWLRADSQLCLPVCCKLSICAPWGLSPEPPPHPALSLTPEGFGLDLQKAVTDGALFPPSVSVEIEAPVRQQGRAEGVAAPA